MKFDSVSDLRKNLSWRSGHCILKGVGRPVTDCSDLFEHLIVKFLDAKTRREWERSLGRSTKPPSFSEICDFLEETLLTQEVLRVSRDQHSRKAF